MYAMPYATSLDARVGWAYVAIQERVYVWDWQVAAGTAVAPSCFFLPAPPSSTREPQPCFYAFLPWSTHTPEPGLVAIGKVSGHVFLAESVTAGAGWAAALSEHDATPLGEGAAPRAKLNLSSGESVTAVQRVASMSLMVATSQGRLFRIKAYLQGARLHLSAFLVNAPRSGFLGRLLGMGEPGPTVSSLDFIGSMDLHLQDGEAHLVTASRRAAQIWSVDPGKGAVQDQVLSTISTSSCSSALVEALGGTPSSFSEDGLEISSAAFLPGGEVALLYTYAPAQSRFRAQAPSARKLAVCVFPPRGDGQAVIYPIRELDLDADPRPQSTPRLVAAGGPTLAVVTPNTVVQIVLDSVESSTGPKVHTSAYQHITELQSTRQNRIVGFTSVPGDGWVSSLLLLTARTGTLLLEVNWPMAQKSVPRPSMDPSKRQDLQVRDGQRALESAVFFADVPGQPLDLRLHVSGSDVPSLATAAETVSQDITLGTASLLPALVDVQQHLTDRTTRLRALITVLAEAGAASKLPLATRQQLAADAELMASAEAVWKENFAFSSSTSLPKILVQAIDRAMLASDASTFSSEDAQDTLRAFFRTNLGRWDKLLSQLHQGLLDARLATADLATRTRAVIEVDSFLVPAHAAAQAVRTAKDPVHAAYELASPLMYAPWTASETDIDLLETAFGMSVSLLKERSATLGSLVDVSQPLSRVDGYQGSEHAHQAALRNYLPHLAAAVLDSYMQALDHAQGKSKARFRGLSQRFAAAKHPLILPLNELGLSDDAIRLAERAADFDALAIIVLSLRDPKAGHALPRLAPHFLDRYGAPFADALYRRLLAAAEYRTLLAPDESRLTPEQVKRHAALLRDFLHPTKFVVHDSAPSPTTDQAARLRWIVEVGDQQFLAASKTLETLAEGENTVEKKRLELSVSKLALLAGGNVGDARNGGADTATDAQTMINARLSALQIQRRLGSYVRTVLGDEVDLALGNGGAEQFVDLAASRLELFPCLRAQLLDSIEKVRNGTTLGVEDLVDAWSLLDAPPGEDESPQAQALQAFLLVGAALPPARAEALLASLWRRVLLSTDWGAVASTRGLSERETRERLRQTSMYRVLRSVNWDETAVHAHFPENILSAPSADVVRARWGEAEMEPHLADLQGEADALYASLAQTLPPDVAEGGALTLSERAEAQLWAWPNQVRRLVLEELGGQSLALGWGETGAPPALDVDAMEE